MSAHDTALVLERDPQGGLRIAEPVPDRAIVSLAALVQLRVREWVLVTPDGDGLEVCGHKFACTGWISSYPPGVVVEHTCAVCPKPEDPCLP